MIVTIKGRIYLSFALLVLLFVANGIFSIITLNNNTKLSNRISSVIGPSIQAVEEFQDILVESKMYTTDWVFLRSSQADKDALIQLHNTVYPKLRLRLNFLFSRLNDVSMSDSLNKVFTGFEELLIIEKRIMYSLAKFEDYNDPAAKMESERLIEDEVLPRTTSLMNILVKIISYEQESRVQKNNALERSSMLLRMLITVLAISIICIGIFLSVYFTKIILGPINQIRNIINDIGKGILQRANYTENRDEMGEMAQAVNSLSQKLEATASFAHEVGLRNFDVPFQPLSDRDVLGKALITMRDNLKNSEVELVEAHTEIQTIYKASLDAVIIIDELGKIVKWDHKAEILFGWKEDEVMGSLLTTCIIPFKHREAHQKGMDRFFKTGEGPILGKTIEITALAKNNTEFDISLSISSVLIKDKYRFIGFIRDITLRKKAEARLHKSEADLEINNKQLLQKNRELEQFAFVASHDLQEPLRTTVSFVEIFKRQYFGKIDAKADQYLNYIVQASDRMSVLIKDLLDFSRIGINKDLEKVDCNDILEEVMADLDKVMNDTGAEITSEDLPVVIGYATEIKQLFQNLIINSIKFRKTTVRPKINISVHAENDYWCFAFNDNGIGIDQQHYERIFIIFQRLHNRTDYDGSGIGLSHCKKIVELHHGKIWVESTHDAGTTFYFTLHSPKQHINETKIKLHTAH